MTTEAYRQDLSRGMDPRDAEDAEAEREAFAQIERYSQTAPLPEWNRDCWATNPKAEDRSVPKSPLTDADRHHIDDSIGSRCASPDEDELNRLALAIVERVR